MSRLAAIDIGTNSTRVLVADAHGRGPHAPLALLDRRMRITRLGQGVDASRRLHPDAVERTLAVLREYRGVIDDLGGATIRATATSAARDAANRDELFVPARDILGVDLELLSGDDEAQLSFLGATHELRELGEPAPYFVVDIGGGSTECILGTDKPDGLLSVDIGCVRITEQFLHGDPPDPEELSSAVSIVHEYLADVEQAIPSLRDAKTLVGLAGTVSTVAAVEIGLAEYDRTRIHHFRLTRPAAEDVFRTLATEPAESRRHNPGLEPGRVDVIVGGALILVTVLRHFGFDEMLVSESDILDGLVRSIA
jgi:exopolyphosphatase/guanosine-5'-triphosphate,3'-diphosphate pyrophosphatase